MNVQSLQVAEATITNFEEQYEAGLAQVEARMLEIVDSEVELLRDASRHVISAGGKRVRPRMVLLSYAALGGEDFGNVASIAGAVELLHTASVVHDDINDHGVLRRGRPSVNALYGRTFALLTGDFLFTKVYELIAPYGDMNAVLADATTALVEGETMQAVAVKQRQFTRATYYRIIGLKTAVLFAAAARLGAMAAGASSREADALSNYGYRIGLAFQIIDDVLDVIGSPEQLGKTSGIDIDQGRGFAVAYETADGKPIDPQFVDPMLSIRQHVLNGDALTEARAQAGRFVDEALEEIAFLPETPAKAALTALAHGVIDRDL